MSERKLATIRRINAITPIEGADKIVCATVDGWKLVTAIDNGFKVGDLVVYLEIDSWVPHHVAPFLSKDKEPREYNGVKGERLRTIKLRGQVSQGLIMPLSVLPHSLGYEFAATEGEDVTHWLNIQKWERPIPVQMAGKMRGNFPSFIFKTDQERIQNLAKKLDSYRGLTFEVTEKLEGSSMTAYRRAVDETVDFGVCSRNIDLIETEENIYWQVARKYDLPGILERAGLNIALQGELIGPNVEGNIYGLKEHEFRLFDIFDINTATYWDEDRRDAFAAEHGILIAPPDPKNPRFTLHDATIDDILAWAEEFPSSLAPVLREGIVFKCIEDPNISFKAISNKYLLKKGD